MNISHITGTFPFHIPIIIKIGTGQLCVYTAAI